MSTTTSEPPRGAWAGVRVLVLSPVPTAPVTLGNRARILEVNRALRREGARTALLHYPSDEAWRTRLPRAAQAEMARQWDEVFLCPVTRPLHARPASGPDHAIDEWWDPAIGQMLDWLFRVGRYDALIVNYTWLSKALEHAPPDVLRILDTHDRFAGRRALLAAHGIAPEYFHTTEAEEAIALGRADIVWAIKEQEAEAFRRLTPRPVATLPHVEAFAPETPRRAPDGVLRLGILGGRNSINATNIRAFIREADAYLRRTLLPVEVVLAGSVCGLLERLRLPWLRMMGEVEQVDTFYEAVDVVLAPLAFSTGLKIKVGEALSRGLPVISHAHAFEGYEPSHPFHACADFAAMLRAAHRLVREPDGIAALAEASRRSAAVARAAVARTLAEAGRRAARLPPSVVIAMRFDQARPGLLAFDHALDAARYAGLRAPVLLHLSGTPEAADPAALRLLAAAARIAVEPAAGPLPPAVAEALDAETLRRESLPALLAEPHLAAWFVALPDAPPAAPVATRLGIAHAGLAHIAAAEALAPLARAFPRFLLLESGPGPETAALLRASGAERATAPLLWRGEESRLLAALRGGRPGPVAILAADAGAPGLLPILAFATGTLGRSVILFAPGGQPPSGPASGPLAIRPGSVSLAPAAAFLDPATWRGRRPAFVVEHGRPPGAGPVRELALRAGIAHLRTADPGAPEVLAIPPGPSARARGLASAALAMAAYDRAAETPPDGAAAEEFARDAGWARIWAELGRLIG
ncbi:hypothetical protein FHS88_002143 [Roseomonas alkaliterrae]|uniref:Glycosyltransferase n=4 Tax=Neoroseomonas alkaliterrae TaxID=1452450 RepID=A0A840Y0T2_9PROT|nr:glycosyltransferase [Neoroseomonas alkaliterrae]MBB5690017.1 hypothetical protein [Neoroseomonas alkaliterrae]